MGQDEFVSSDDWYRSTSWSDADRELFERKLSKARRASRAQYLRLKALALLETSDAGRRATGVELLERVLSEYPEDRVEVAGAHRALARYYEERGDAERAAEHYRDTLRAQEGTNVFHGAELLLAELIVRERLTDCYPEADALLDRVLESGPIFRSEQFRYAVARARLASRRGDDDEGAAFALGALDLFEHNEPVSSYHRNIGLIRADEATLSELKALARQGKPEAVSDLIDRYRGPNGAVRWDWSLVSRLRGVPEGSRLQAQDDFHAASEPLVDELRAGGLDVYDLSDWSSRKLPSAAAVKTAVPILLRWFDRTDNLQVKTAIATALTDARARKLAAGRLIEHFRQMKAPDLNGDDRPTEVVGAQRALKDRLANALATLARDEHFDDVAELIRDPGHGGYRTYLFWALPYMNHPGAVDLALEMLDDDEMHVSALRALADLRSERGRPVLQAIAAEPKPRGRSDEDRLARVRIEIAERGLEKLDKASARGKSRP